MSVRLVPDPNAIYLKRITSLLGGNLGVVFLIWYVVELLLLLLNPIDVLAHSEPRYVVYHAMLGTASSENPPAEYFYDFACWLQDHKKLFAYALLLFWMMTFATLAIGRLPRGFRSCDTDWGQFERLSAGAKILPFHWNCLVSVLLTMLFGGAAFGLPYLGSNDTSLCRFVTETSANFRNPFFVAYRLAYPTLLFAVLLHLVISSQFLLHISRNMGEWKPHPHVSRHVAAIILFAVAAAWTMALLWQGKLGELGWSSLKDNFFQMLFTMAIVGWVVFIVFRIDPRRMPPPPAATGMPGLLSSLPGYCLVCLAPLAVPWIVLWLATFWTGTGGRRDVVSALTPYLKCIDEFAKSDRSQRSVERVVAKDRDVRVKLADKKSLSERELGLWMIADHWKEVIGCVDLARFSKCNASQ